MTSSFLIENILRKECEKSPTGNMLNDFFYFLKIFKVAPEGWMAIKSNDISALAK